MTPEEKSKNLIGLFSGWHNEDKQMQRVLAARAAAGMLDSDAAAATMTEARQSIAASAEAMAQDFDAFMVAECEIRPDGIIDEYSSNTEGHW